jgi:DNA-binding transcriptional LysR family regulator
VNLDHLRTFCDVARRRSVSKGAQDAGVSQPAASQAVRHLEEHLGVRLLDRSKRPLEVTEEGELLLQGAEVLLDSWRALEERVRHRSVALEGVVRVATIYSVGLYAMPRMLARFRANHPRTRVEHECVSGRRVVEAVKSDQADLGIVAYPRQTRTLGFRSLPAQEMVLVCHPRHPLAGKGPVTRRELQGSELLVYDAGLPIRRATDRFLRDHKITIAPVMEIDTSETLKQALKLREGAALMPAPNVQPELREGTLLTRRLGFGEFTRPLGVLYRLRRRLPPAATTLMDSICAEAKA